jgi:Ca-activated chloride channel family protein
MHRLLQLIIGFVIVISPTVATAACSIALALTVDVSGSITKREYRLQMDGLAAALRERMVADALVASEAALMLVQWSGASQQEVSINWQRMLSLEDVRAFAMQAESTPRAWYQFGTGIGNALMFTSAQFGEVEDCERSVIDVSGDGHSNEGPDPLEISQALAWQGFQINGLAIEASEFGLTEYFKHNVVAGEAAFVFKAETYADYPRTIWRKLLSELIIPIS